jgi:hypothetical protein
VLLFFRPQDQIPGLKNAHLSNIAALVGLTAMVGINLSRRQLFTRITPELIAMVVFGFIIAVTIPLSFWPGGAFEQFRNNYVPIFFTFVLMINSITSPKRVDRIRVGDRAGVRLHIRAHLIRLHARSEHRRRRASVRPGRRILSEPERSRAEPGVVSAACAHVREAPRTGNDTPALCGHQRAHADGYRLHEVARRHTWHDRDAHHLRADGQGAHADNHHRRRSGRHARAAAMPDSFWSRMESITDSKKDETGSREERRLLLKQGWMVFSRIR